MAVSSGMQRLAIPGGGRLNGDPSGSLPGASPSRGTSGSFARYAQIECHASPGELFRRPTGVVGLSHSRFIAAHVAASRLPVMVQPGAEWD
jgi:hypothetical protein